MLAHIAADFAPEGQNPAARLLPFKDCPYLAGSESETLTCAVAANKGDTSASPSTHRLVPPSSRRVRPVLHLAPYARLASARRTEPGTPRLAARAQLHPVGV